MCVYIWLIHVDVWQKPTQYYKASILQLKKNFKGRRGEEKERKRRRDRHRQTHIILIYQCILMQFYLEVLLMHDYLGILKPEQT